MIYDIRQTTTYHYASSVAYARHVLRLTPIDRMGQRVHAAALDIEPAPIERREGRDFFGNRMTWIELDQPHDTLSVRVATRVAVKRDVARKQPRLGKRFARPRSPPSISPPTLLRITCFRAGKSRSIRKFAPTPLTVFWRGARSSTPPSI